MDTGPTAQAAATIFGYAEAARPGNALVAVNTECHLDHLAGNAYVRARGIDIYGHCSVLRAEAELATEVEDYRASVVDPERADEAPLLFLGTHVENPNRVVEGDTTIDLDGVGAELLLVPGHTAANLAVWVAEDHVLYTGDTVVSDYRPNLASGTPADWRLWLQALDRLSGLGAEFLVPGHGRVLQGGEIAAEFDRIRNVLLRALAEA